MLPRRTTCGPFKTTCATSRAEIDAKYDYRYSQLIIVFGALLRQQRIQEDDLLGLSEEKLASIRRVATL